MPTQTPTARSIFDHAVELTSDAERKAYLDEACADAPDLRQQVEALLQSYAEAGSFLESPAISPPRLGGEGLGEGLAEGPGSIIGPYKLLQQIGEGGMGVVFMAEQTHPVQRTVALKIIRPGMDTRQVIARFEAERQALALMDHPNIARVLDAGTTGEKGDSHLLPNGPEGASHKRWLSPFSPGRPYFVMDLVKGVPITQFCDQQHLTIRQRLELMVQVCHAVQHAHQKGIIHRDLKPSNVLVTGGLAPFAESAEQKVPVPFVPEKPLVKVIDFGVAKATAQRLTERTMFTEYGQLIGTFEYMSPEQARFNQLDVDTRSDIYSLGVLLYELLAGSTPFEQKRLREVAFDDVLRIIREEEPPNPSTKLSTSDMLPSIAANRHTEPSRLSKEVQGELDWIVMKALEKDRNRRYDSAANLAADIDRQLCDKPVEAGPPSAVYRFRKFATRNRTVLIVGALLALAAFVALGAIASGIVERRARRARVTGQLEIILDEVERLQQAEKWHEALLAVRRAEPALAAGDAAPEIQIRARQALADLELVQRLDDIRARTGMVWAHRYLTPLPVKAEQDYAAAFRNAGIDLDALPAKEAAERIGARGQIAPALLPALDDWVAVRSMQKNEAAIRRLVDVLRTADPDPWRKQVRECLVRKDWAALETLARSPELERQPAATIGFLSSALRTQAESDTDRPAGDETELGHRGFLLEIEILRRAQRRYPADYWINRRLGMDLIWLNSPPFVVQEGIGYMRAAVALLPQDAEVMMHLAKGYEFLGEYDQVIDCYRRALELAPHDGLMHNGVAWNLVASADVTLHDSDEALEWAETAVELAPQDGAIWNTLGVAQYRVGNLSAAVESLQKSMDLRHGGDSFDWFFLAMAHRQLGHQDEARQWYEKAVDWADNNPPKNPLVRDELIRFRAEATKLLGVTEPQSPTKPRPLENEDQNADHPTPASPSTTDN